MSLAGTLCYNLSKRIVLTRRSGAVGENPASFDLAKYQEWRDEELRTQFTEHFRFDEVEGKDVLDFGCGGGALSLMLARHNVKSLTGTDLNEQMIAQAEDELSKLNGSLPVTPRFVLGRDSRKIEFPDNSFDVVLCFDVLEHIIDYREIIPEWQRVLRPGGKVFIWWVPWFHPYGHHIESLVPLPWVHAFFSEQTLIEACARVYAMPEFKPRWWDLDEHGRRKPNKYLTLDRFTDLNKLTIREFEKLCRQEGLQLATRELIGFGGSAAARLTRILAQLPVTREFFCSRVIYRLQK
jgi:ubiquinone/menaquinone biosynthesis C-methylase UbiE